MTKANDYLGKRKYHGALATNSPFRIAPVTCLACGKIYESRCEIRDELCHGCWLQGYRLDPATKTVRRRLEIVGKM